jgi:hypothetical protein
MRKLVTALLALTLAAPALVEGQAALSLSSGWKFGGRMAVQQGDLNTAAAVPFAAELSFPAHANASGILLVEYQPTTLRLDSNRTGFNEEVSDIDVWYFMIGGSPEITDRGPVVPFAIAALGIAWFNPTGGNPSRSSETLFAGTFGGGARVPLGQSDRVSLRLEGRMNLTIPFAGASIYCGGGGGCYGGFGGYVGPVQGSLLAGLRFALGPR